MMLLQYGLMFLKILTAKSLAAMVVLSTNSSKAFINGRLKLLPVLIAH